MLRALYLISAVLSFVTFSHAFPQQPPEVGRVKLYRYGELLQQHNIELTEPALINALKNPDPDVRYLAAMKLAEDKAFATIPAIEEAVRVEKDPRDQVNMALALGLLSDQIGLAKLKKVCADKNFVPEFRLYAVRYMFDLHSQKDEDCLAAAEQLAASRNVNIGDRVSALSLLPSFQNLTTDESPKIVNLVANCLEDSEPVVQLAASSALVNLGGASAIPYLRSAIAREKDENVRAAFERDLKRLEESAK